MTAHPSARSDALIVGGGLAGAATALRLARRGHRVTIVDRALDAGSPLLLNTRAVAALTDLDIEAPVDAHRVDRVRLAAAGESTTIDWPTHPTLPNHGLVTATLRDALVAEAAAAGAIVLGDHNAVAPIIDRGFVRGAYVIAPDGTDFEARATITVVADGANSRFGRALGTYREPSWPYGLAHHGSFPSGLHGSTAIELVLDLRDRSGTPITGHGWMYPTGTGSVNVGVIMMSTSPSFHVINPSNLFQRLVERQRDDWEITGPPIAPATGRRVPMGLSVGPSAGPTYLLIGDAVGAANPLGRTGVESALETASFAAAVIDESIQTGDAAHLQRYPQLLTDRYGNYYKVGRLANRILGQPAIARRAERLVASRRSMAEAYVRFATETLRPGRGGRPEAAYRFLRAVSIFAPDA